MVIGIFICILLGSVLGNVRIARFRLGLAGVLLIAMLWGYCSVRIESLDNMLTRSVCNWLTALGSSLFIAIVGFQAGRFFISARSKHLWKAVACGVCFVGVGIVAICIIRVFDKEIPLDMLMGIFAGSMTSTPAMSSCVELFGTESQVSVGYGLSYWLGLVLVVMAMQFLPVSQSSSQADFSRQQTTYSISKFMNQRNALLYISYSIVLGLMLVWILPIGDTGCVLVSGMVIGLLHAKIKKETVDMQALKSIGLALFYVGAGVIAGQSFCGQIYWRALLYGAFVAVTAMTVGYILVRFIFRFDRKDTLTILGGGMTSTPAIGTLQERVADVNLSLYASSYVGALITIVSFIELLNGI